MTGLGVNSQPLIGWRLDDIGENFLFSSSSSSSSSSSPSSWRRFAMLFVVIRVYCFYFDSQTWNRSLVVRPDSSTPDFADFKWKWKGSWGWTNCIVNMSWRINFASERSDLSESGPYWILCGVCFVPLTSSNSTDPAPWTLHIWPFSPLTSSLTTYSV